MAFNKERAQVVALLRGNDPEEFAFITAVSEACEGRPQTLAAILRSDAELTKVYRAWLADLVDGRFDRPSHRPASLFPSPVEKIAARRSKHELKKADEKYRIVPKAIQQAMAEAKAEGISVGYRASPHRDAPLQKASPVGPKKVAHKPQGCVRVRSPNTWRTLFVVFANMFVFAWISLVFQYQKATTAEATAASIAPTERTMAMVAILSALVAAPMAAHDASVAAFTSWSD